MAKRDRDAGLGRGLCELLEDNREITNMTSNVTMHREDGSSVKIYDKTGSKKPQENKKSSPIVIKR